jgi:hypothetical protein
MIQKNLQSPYILKRLKFFTLPQNQRKIKPLNA